MGEFTSVDVVKVKINVLHHTMKIKYIGGVQRIRYFLHHK
jgi:hypothetical protein